MKQRRELGAMMLVANERIGLEHRFEPLDRLASSISDFCQLFDVCSDVTLVPGDQDRFHIRKVLVQGGPSDARLLGDLRHGDRMQAVFRHQARDGVQNRVAYLAAVRIDRLGPKLRHRRSIGEGRFRDISY